uniref:Uncharacterized protein n=1 Tax=Oryza sativa subsp. japonica TaxID=39947 RepID=Q6YW94_ORYSJ|nr:hypothetical protein [Oryza sativa Japonica Group]
MAKLRHNPRDIRLSLPGAAILPGPRRQRRRRIKARRRIKRWRRRRIERAAADHAVAAAHRGAVAADQVRSGGSRPWRRRIEWLGDDPTDQGGAHWIEQRRRWIEHATADRGRGGGGGGGGKSRRGRRIEAAAVADRGGGGRSSHGGAGIHLLLCLPPRLLAIFAREVIAATARGDGLGRGISPTQLLARASPKSCPNHVTLSRASRR